MAHYEKMTVATLRALLKDRGIPSTGLTRKAQIIERLIAEDSHVNATEVQVNAATAPTDPPKIHTSSGPALPEEAQTAKDAASAVVAINGNPLQENITSEGHGKTQQDETMPDVTQPALEPPSVADERDLKGADPQQNVVAEPSLTTSQSIDENELREDSRKRKRRSATPPVNEAEMATKRAKHVEEGAPAGVSAEGNDPRLVEDTKKAPEPVAVDVTPTKTQDRGALAIEGDPITTREKDPQIEGQKVGELSHEHDPIDNERAEALTTSLGRTSVDDEKNEAVLEQALPSPPGKRPSIDTRDNRFKFLSQPTSSAQGRNPSPAPDDTTTTSPATHPATSALYIKNLQRPLREEQLRERLIHLATSTGDSSAELKTFFLDAVRTHALVIFSSVSAASRVRSAMHDRVWPQERDRKPLWVDFVPEERVQDWIEVERSGGPGARAGGRRWEVVYAQDQDGQMGTQLQEVGTTAPPRHARAPSSSQIAQTQPQVPAQREPQPDAARRAPVQPIEAQKTFRTLDSLFKSTTRSKPKLYFQPVSTDVVQRRLREFSVLTKRDWNEHDRRPTDELRRYTFEDDDVLVDGGSHFMSKKQMAKEGIISTGTREPAFRSRRGGGPPRQSNDRYRRGGYNDKDNLYRSDRRMGESYRPK